MAVVVLAGACGSSATTTSTGATAPPGPAFYGPPSWAVNPQGLGASGDGTYNLIFADADGVRYVVHTAAQPLFPDAKSPDRSGHGQLADGTPVIISCDGTSMSGSSVGSATTGTSIVAGPLMISWSRGDLVVSVLQPQETGPCSPTPDGAAPLIALVGSLPELDAAQWDQFVREHPIPLTGDSTASTSATATSG